MSHLPWGFWKMPPTHCSKGEDSGLIAIASLVAFASGGAQVTAAVNVYIHCRVPVFPP
jgi:hypothetical protein